MTMIDRVAAAIAMKSGGWTKNAKDYIPHARAAIEAMREPTEALHKAAEGISVYYDDFSLGDGNVTLGSSHYRARFDEIWAELIDAALEGK